MLKNQQNIRGIDVHYAISGKNPKIGMLFIHGNKLSALTFEKVLSSALSEHYTLIALYLPGFGETSVPEDMKEQITWVFTKQLIVDFIEIFGFKKIILFGHSLGGNLAIECVPKIKNCIGLVTLSTQPLPNIQALASAYAPNVQGAKSFIPLLSKEDMKGIAREMSPNVSHHDFLFEIIQKVDAQTVTKFYESFSHEMEDEVDLINNRLKFPCLNIQISADPFINPDYYKEAHIQNQFNDGPLIIEGNGHVAQLDYQDLTARAIERYLKHINHRIPLIVSMKPMKTAKKTLLGVDIQYYQSGENNDTCIFFFHGNKLSAKTFEKVLNSGLSNEYSMIALDLPGFGETKVPEGMKEQITWKFLKQLIIQFVHSFSFKHTILCGHSFGGHLAIESLQQIPTCRGLVIFGTPPLPNMEQSANAFLPNPNMQLLFKGKLCKSEIEQLSTQFSLVKKTQQNLAEWMRSVQPEVLQNIYGSVTNEIEDEVKILRSIRSFPICCFQLSNDPFINVDYIKNLKLPNLFERKLHLINGKGHMPQMDYCRETESIIRNYLSKTNANPQN